MLFKKILKKRARQVQNPVILMSEIDFENNQEKAKEWGEDHYGDWIDKNLLRTEKKAILDYAKRNYEAINQYLFTTKGELIKEKNRQAEITNLLTKYSIDQLNEQVELIEQGLARARTPQSLFVYRRIRETDIDVNFEPLYDDFGKINETVFTKLKEDFTNKYFTNYGFLSTSLVASQEHFAKANRKMPILMKILLPKNTHGAFLAELSSNDYEIEMLIQRGATIKYEDFAIIHEQGKQIVKVTAKLVI